MSKHFGYKTKGKKKSFHYDAHVTPNHITARNIREAKRKAIQTLKVRKS